jgi:hypothetical protein
MITHEWMFLVLSAISKLACLILFGCAGRQTPGVCGLPGADDARAGPGGVIE